MSGTNQSSKLSKSARRRAAKKRKQVGGTISVSATSAPAAMAGVLRTKMGISDIRDLDIGYLAGYTYVGNNTLGTNDEVYFLDQSATYTNIKGIPIEAGSAYWGQSYVTDVEKHFARKVVHRVEIELCSLNPSTSNSMVVNIAPHRGGCITTDSMLSDTTAANSQAAVMGAQGQLQVASWQSAVLNLTPYIAGGTGPRQNEFDLDSSGGTDQSQLVPCGFYVSGSSSTSALRGTKVHAVIVRLRISLLDFLGGMSDTAVGKSINQEQRIMKVILSRFPSLAASVAAGEEKKETKTPENYVCIDIPRDNSKRIEPQKYIYTRGDQ